MSRPAITGRRTRSMIEDLRLVEPSMPYGAVYRVTGDWERLVESRQALEWAKFGCFALLLMIFLAPHLGSSDAVEAVYGFAFVLVNSLVVAGLDAIWVARHANDLELVDRASSGLDEWRAKQAAEREPELVFLGLLVFGGGGAWMLWAAVQPDSSLNPWIVVPMALLLIGVPLRGGLARWRHRKSAGS